MGLQISNRIVNTLVRQLKGAKVRGDGATSTQSLMGEQGFLGIHMDVAHEPAWLVGADGKQSDVGRTEPLANLLEVSSPSRIARKEETPMALRNLEATPKGTVAPLAAHATA